jgi:hypothetical protein
MSKPNLDVHASIEGLVNDHSAWLRQATEVRDEALRLLRGRFTKDLESVAQLVGSRHPEALASKVEYADKLMADYLAKSEKLFELMGRLARDGGLHTPQSRERGIKRN